MWNNQDLSKALNIKINFNFTAQNLAIDSRSINPNEIFLAFSNKNDGHLHIDSAIEKGAVCAIGEYIPENCKHKSKVIVVENTLNALTNLGIYKRKKANNLKSIAVTGSVGKTTTKEMLAHVFKQLGSTVFSKASYNNHIGVPLTLAELNENTQFGIFEIGMNNIGEIKPLSNYVKPDIAIITTIAPSHIGNMGSIEAIVNEKTDIFSGIAENGFALLHGDHYLFEQMKFNAQKYNVKNIFTVGKNNGLSAQIESYKTEKQKSFISAKVFNKLVKYQLNYVGEHYALDSLYVLLCAEILGVDINHAAEILSSAKPFSGRGQMLKFITNSGDPIFVFDDSYNANPVSMKAGITSFCEIQSFGKKIAILAQMGELGKFSEQYHIEIGEFLNTQPIDIVHVIGTEAKPLYNALNQSKKGLWKENINQLKEEFLNSLNGNESIFIKGSNSQKLHELIPLMKEKFELSA